VTLRRWTIFIVGTLFVVSAALFGVVSASKADPPSLFPDCYTRPYATSHAYQYQGVWINAGPWLDYDLRKTQISPDSECWDINVEVASTQGFTVRVQFCPKPLPAPQFSCYVNSWGTVTGVNGFTTGCAAPDTNYPNAGTILQFYFRMETYSTPESIWVIF
jgi:hypothetical protein